MPEKYVALYDNYVSYDTYNKPDVYILDELTVDTLDNLLVELGFGDYEEFISNHCAKPGTPQGPGHNSYPGTFGDSTHLKYEVGDPGSNGAFGDILSGKVTTVEVADDSGAPEAPWSARLRFFPLEDYAKMVRDRVKLLNSMLEN